MRVKKEVGSVLCRLEILN